MTAAGWYPDPGGRHGLRYFDGAAWSDHVGDGTEVGTDPLGALPPGLLQWPEPELMLLTGAASSPRVPDGRPWGTERVKLLALHVASFLAVATAGLSVGRAIVAL
jgi:hypothetical protein